VGCSQNDFASIKKNSDEIIRQPQLDHLDVGENSSHTTPIEY